MIPLSDEPPVRRRLMPIVVVSLILLNVLVFLFELSYGGRIIRLFTAYGVVPAEYYAGRDLPPEIALPFFFTLFTSQFLHGGFLHLGSNMLFLWVFGDNVEDAFGHLRFLLFYLICGIFAGLTHIFVSGPSDMPSLGASGAIAGVLAAYVLMFPQSQVRTFILPVFLTRVSALLLIGFWIVLQVINGIVTLDTTGGGIAYWAHIGGFVAGLILTPVFRALGAQPTRA